MTNATNCPKCNNSGETPFVSVSGKPLTRYCTCTIGLKLEKAEAVALRAEERREHQDNVAGRNRRTERGNRIARSRGEQ